MTPANYFLELDRVQAGDSVIREHGADGPGWSHFTRPTRVESTRAPNEIVPILERLSSHVGRGGCGVVALAYEAASAFDSALVHHKVGAGPLCWAASYATDPIRYRELAPVSSAPIELLEPHWTFEVYQAAFERVRQALERGDSYQVNLTFPQKFRIVSTPIEFFASRCGVDPPPYSAYLELDGLALCSLSPELLFERDGPTVSTRPMKGTAPAPAARKDLGQAMTSLRSDPKTIAENTMIVDMARNDLGRVCRFGSVRTTKLLEVEKHRELLQVVSTVEGQTDADFVGILQALFPAASVTGAPKVETMKLISELEEAPRGFYCGAIGVVRAGKERFSVAIRTAEIESNSSSGRFGIGSGIVWDSSPENEYEECLLKRDRLLNPGALWQLRDALAVDRLGDPSRVEAHLDRLEAGAKRFDIPFDRDVVRARILEHRGSRSEPREKVRITIDRSGSVETNRLPSVVEAEVMHVALAESPINSRDPNMVWKTTSRAELDDARDRLPEMDDVLLFNEHGRVTEFGYANAVVEWNGKLYTPFVEDGCLAGIGVQELIDQGKVERAHVPLEWLSLGARVFYVNSVAGLVPTVLHPSQPGNSPEISASRR